MCGLFGEFGQDVLRDKAALAAISRSIRHRGPDDDGLASGNGWMLGFRRLAILDLSPAGHQPLFHDDGRYVLVYNGEIYNYLELKAELLAAGEHFRSGTDTEELLKLLIREGAAALPRLNGMFAFAFVDMERLASPNCWYWPWGKPHAPPTSPSMATPAIQIRSWRSVMSSASRT